MCSCILHYVTWENASIMDSAKEFCKSIILSKIRNTACSLIPFVHFNVMFDVK